MTLIKKVADVAHPTMSFRTLFSLHETAAAFATLEDSKLFDCASPFFRVRRRQSSSQRSLEKVELSAPLHRMWEVSARYVPPPLLRVFQGLEAEAMDFAHSAMSHPYIPKEARSEFLKDIGRRSVFRIWRYSPGCGCRPHYDPGFCTALLLQASAPGLEVNLQEKYRRFPGDSDSYHDGGKDSDGTVEAIKGWETPGPGTGGSGEALVLGGNMMHVLSHGALPPVLHRVRTNWAEDSEMMRYNFVVELRPADPRRWYNLAVEHQQPKKGSLGRELKER